MFKKILVPIDMSSVGQKVFEEALSLAKSQQSSLILLHVLSAEEEGSPLPVPSDLSQWHPAVGNDLTLESWRKEWEDFEKESLDTLELRMTKAKQMGVGTTVKQVYGSPSRVICKIAKQEEVDLIIMGHRGRSGLEELIMGSVSNYVFHHAPCSVLIVNN